MSAFKKITFILLLSFLNVLAFSQNYPTKKRFAKQAEKFGNYHLAMEIYIQLNQKTNKNKFANKAAEMALLARNYQKVYDLGKIKEAYDSSNGFLMEQCQLSLMLNDVEATAFYLDKLTMKANSFSPNEAEKFRLLTNQIKLVEHRKQMQETFGVKVKPINELTPNNQPNGKVWYYSPNFYADYLYYLKISPDSNPQSPNLYQYQIIESQNNNNNWLTNFTFTIPLAEENQFVSSFYPISSKNYVLSICEKNQNNQNTCFLTFAERNAQKIEFTTVFPKKVANPNYFNADPFVISLKNKIGIYFTSTQKGGKGGKDIWYVEYREKSNKFSSPRTLNSKINTSGNEITPKFSDGVLYFSSDFNEGFGGYDIYEAYGKKTNFAQPQNLSAFNTMTDEFGYTINTTDSSKGILISNRPSNLNSSTCCDNFFAFEIEKSPVKKIPIRLYNKTKNSDSLLLKEAYVQLFYIDKKTNEPILVMEDTNATGQFTFKIDTTKVYLLKAQKKGYLSETWEIPPTKYKNNEPPINLYLTKIEKEEIVIPNIYYDFNSANLTTQSKEIIKITLFNWMINNPDVKIQINSHTDSKGTEEYNQTLSQQRADGVKQYLIDLGIDSKRLKAKGYGESKPLEPNQNPDGTDNPEGRQKNRRTTFQVIP